MPEREVKIINKLGIHARPAAEIVKTAGKFKSNITIVRDDHFGTRVDGAFDDTIVVGDRRSRHQA